MYNIDRFLFYFIYLFFIFFSLLLFRLVNFSLTFTLFYIFSPQKASNVIPSYYSIHILTPSPTQTEIETRKTKTETIRQDQKLVYAEGTAGKEKRAQWSQHSTQDTLCQPVCHKRVEYTYRIRQKQRMERRIMYIILSSIVVSPFFFPFLQGYSLSLL